MRGSCTDRAVVQTLVLLLVLLPVCTCQAASAVETFRPVLTFGSEGNGTGQFGGTLTGPWGISVDESGMIYVADTDNHRVSVFLMDGSPFASWGTGGSADIRAPHGIAASSDGVSVYVADSSNSRIVRYEVISGSWLDWWGVWPTTTSSLPPGQYPSYPLGVAEGPDGRVWVAETENGVVRVYTGSGDEVTSFFCNDPRGIAAAGSDNVYVVSGVDGRVYRYSQAGRYLMRFGEPGTGPGQFDHPNGVAVDAAGNVYVADSGNHRVQKFDSGGHFVASFGTRGSGAGQFEYPEGVAVDSSGHVYVTDRNCRVQKFVCEGTDPVSPPAPAYWFSAWGGEAPFGVQFADGSSENPTSWLWEFDDGTTSTEENPYHVFATPGTYSPRLTVTNAAGGASVTLGDRKIVITESPYLFVRTFGSAGTGAGQLLHPRGLALGQDDVLYVMDRGTHRVTAFSSAGAYLFSFGREGSWYGGADPPVEEFLEPAAIATGPAGTVYVGDQDYQRIKVFSANGTPLGQFRPTGSRLTAVAVGPDGSVYVVCSGAKTIERYDAAGGLVASFGTVPPGADAATYAGSPLALACDPEGDVWLLDPGGETMVVREYGPGGAFLAGWGRTGTAPGEIDLSPYSQFQALAVDRSGDVYVTGEDSSIRRFAPDGTFIARFGSPGTAEGQVGSPVALAVDDQDGVYVASWDGRVQRFTKAGVPAPTHSPVKQVSGGADVPTDTDGDGMYDDVNGNHRPDFADVVLYFNQMSWIAANEPVTAFDCNANGRIDFADVVWLFNHL